MRQKAYFCLSLILDPLSFSQKGMEKSDNSCYTTTYVSYIHNSSGSNSSMLT